MNTRTSDPAGRTAAVLAGLLVLALRAPIGAAQAASDNAPVTVQVRSPQEDERGLSRVLTAAVAGNTLDTALAVEHALSFPRWLKVVPASAEATVYIERRSRTETSSTDDQGRTTVTHTYRIQGLVEVAGLRAPIAVERQVFDTPGAYRDDPAKFSEMAGEVASRAIAAIAERLDTLRPNRAQSGFTFKAKYKFGVKGDGLEVSRVTPGGPADQAGLREKDRIRSIDGEKGTDQMSALAQSWWVDGPGRRYQVEYERDKRRQVVELTLQAPVRSRASAQDSQPPAIEAATRTGRPSGGNTVELEVGMSEAELVRGMGQPQKRISFGPKSVWTYDGFTVTVVAGRVSEVK